MRKKHIIFDFDGTIINTNRVILDSWQATYRHFTGKEGDEDKIFGTFGETLYKSMEEAFPGRSDEAVKVYREYQEAHCEGKVDLFPGIRELIARLKEEERTLSIVTARTTKALYEYLDSFEIRNLFDVIVAYEDTDAHKPDPTPLLLALGKLERIEGQKIDKDDVIMLGDTKFDMGCGANAGVDTVLVGWSIRQNLDEMEKLGWLPKYRIERPDQLLEIA